MRASVVSGNDRRPVGRALAALTASAIALMLAPSAHAVEQEKVFFEYGVDRKSWWWEKQSDQEVTVPVPPGAPVEPSQRVRIPSPQRPDTLPVAVLRGEHERMASLYFDLIARGVTDGSSITSFGFTIEESADKHEQPSFRPGDATILACRIEGFWPDSDGNEEWKTVPKYNPKACVDGKRKATGDVATWSFNATSIVKPWGPQPNQNFGVMLLGDLQKANEDTTWQVNLKIPSRDDAKTAEQDEYQMTKDRVVVTLAFVPGEPQVPAGGSLDPGGSTSFGSSSGGSFSSSSTSFGSGGTSGFSGGSAPASSPAGAASNEQGVESKATPAAAARPDPPRLPAYVWGLLPLGLIALAAVRSVVLEPAGGTRPDGVIAAIRLRNAERRGGPIREVSDPFTRLARAGMTALAVAHRGLRGAGRGISALARKVRRR
jgi:uncharacterized membrane protein YgcG